MNVYWLEACYRTLNLSLESKIIFLMPRVDMCFKEKLPIEMQIP